jgi:hypothetical protein
MPVIEHYGPSGGIEPRICQHADPSNKGMRHTAELVLRDGPHQERYLCREDAAVELAGNLHLLAKAVVELSLR